MFRIQLARQGQTMEQGTIVGWSAREGEEIEVGQELYEIETEKAIIPIEATRPGRLLKIIAQPGQTVPVGAVLALAADPGESVSPDQIEAALSAEDESAGEAAEGSAAARSGAVATDKRREVAPPGTASPRTASLGTASPSAASPGTTDAAGTSEAHVAKITAMPKARALAKELGVNLEDVKGTGAGGLIVPDDVRRAAAARRAAASRRAPLSPISRTMISALEQAWRTPQFTQGIFVDATALVRRKSASEGRLTYMDLFLDAIVRAARSVPELLVRLGDQEALYYDTIDISIATATDHGLLIPVLRDAGALSIDDRAAAWRSVVERARAGKLSPQEMTGGLIALSNLGTRGVDYGTPLLPLGHSAIIFVGSLATRAVAVGDRLEARPSVHVAITYDHRVVDGVLGSRFTGAIQEALLSSD